MVSEKWLLEMNSIQSLFLGFVFPLTPVCLTSALGTLACDEQLEYWPGHTMLSTFIQYSFAKLSKVKQPLCLSVEPEPLDEFT